MEEIKFCEDCKWSRVPETGKEFTRCYHIDLIVPVHRDVSEVYCKVERFRVNKDSRVRCGREGVLWEKK